VLSRIERGRQPHRKATMSNDENPLVAGSSPAIRTNFLGGFEVDGSLDFIGLLVVFVFITGFSLSNLSNPLYHTEHRLASKNTSSG